jgi:hypothetical protein
MISCTEFIPAYSEFFKYIDQKSGRQAVYDFWDALFQPGNSPLDGLITKYGKLRGCWENWYVVYTEEACDNTMLYNEEEGWWLGCMHHCPSKGRFQKLGYMEPFDEYCKHCDSYEIVLGKYGVKHCMDYRGNENATCRSIIYDPEKFKGDPQEFMDRMYACEMEGCKFAEDPSKCPMNRPGTMTLHTTSEAYSYLHPDFHNSLARGVEYIAEHYGEQGLREYLTKFTLAFHKPLLAKIKEAGLSAITEYLKWLYDTEKAPDALQIEESADTLDVTIHYCPAVKHLKSRDIIPHESFEGTCRYVYQALAEESGLGFEMLSYDHDTGAAKFRFFKK